MLKREGEIIVPLTDFAKAKEINFVAFIE